MLKKCDYVFKIGSEFPSEDLWIYLYDLQSSGGGGVLEPMYKSAFFFLFLKFGFYIENKSNSNKL